MAKLTDNSYGKASVRLTKVTRHGERHDLKELRVTIILRGDFVRSYTHGDNSSIVATDTMKNTVYALARQDPIDSIESFGQRLTSHFVERNAHVQSAEAEIQQSLWNRIDSGGRAHDHAFVGGNEEVRTCIVTNARTTSSVTGGLDKLSVLKTTRSGFVGFLRDEFTTLKETTDRIFATSVTASWNFASPNADFNGTYHAARSAMLKTFAEHDSLAVQQTLYAMGEAAIDACPAITDISITMPNQHRLLVNLQPFGMDNPNEIFVPTSEPFGLISGTISRGG